jgi:hypothetical protein
MKIRKIQLPDVHRVPDGFDDYGRFGMTEDGRFFVLSAHSCHPAKTVEGGYWAVNRKTQTFFISPRNISIGFDEFVLNIIKNGKFKQILKMAGIK